LLYKELQIFNLKI